MSFFEARQLSDLDVDHPSLELSIKPHEYSESSEREELIITRAIQLRDFASKRIPVFYHFEDERGVIGRSHIAPKTTIVAAPGVSLRLNILEYRNRSLSQPIYEIYRVQDPGLIPTLGTNFRPNFLTQSFFVDTAPGAAYATGTIGVNGASAPFYDSRLASEEEETAYFGFPRSLAQLQEIVVTDVVGDIQNYWSELFDDSPTTREAVIAGRSSLATRGTRRVFLEPSSKIFVEPVSDGIQFHHPNSSQTLHLHVPALHYTSTPSGRRLEHHQRFAYEIEPGPIVKIVKTGGIRATLKIDAQLVHTNETTNQFQQRIMAPVFEVKDTNFSRIPPQGGALPSNHLRNATVHYDPPAFVGILQTVTDVMVGFIPVLGDARDIAEFVYAMREGRDLWGREVGNWEKALLGVGAVITLIGPSVSAIRRASRTIGDLTASAARVQSAVRQMGLTDPERARLIDLTARIARGGRRLSTVELEWVQALLRRMPQCPSV